MPVRASITYTGVDAIRPSEIRRAVKELLQVEVAAWHDNVLPRHFGRGAKQRYSYQDRSKKYDAYKRKRKGHTRELEWSGEMKKQLLRKARISGTSKKATAAMDCPRYMFQYKPGQPDKATEVVAVTNDEAAAMAFSLDRNLNVKINQNNKPKTVTL